MPFRSNAMALFGVFCLFFPLMGFVVMMWGFQILLILGYGITYILGFHIVWNLFGPIGTLFLGSFYFFGGWWLIDRKRD